jgi:glycine cleavage system regulatory protein
VLVQALEQLKTRGLTVVVQPDHSTAAEKPARLNSLELVGQDRPGIVREISRVLAHHGVNVEELHTECASAAMSGETLFKARARLSIPADCNAEALRRELEKIAADLIVEISLAELPNQAKS